MLLVKSTSPSSSLDSSTRLPKLSHRRFGVGMYKAWSKGQALLKPSFSKDRANAESNRYKGTRSQI